MKDAHNQKDSILELCEITDLIGAIEFSNKTKQVFKENKR